MTAMLSIMCLSLVAGGLWTDMRRRWPTPADLAPCEYYTGRHRAAVLP